MFICGVANNKKEVYHDQQNKHVLHPLNACKCIEVKCSLSGLDPFGPFGHSEAG